MTTIAINAPIVQDTAGFISRTKPTTFAGTLTAQDMLDLADYLGDRIAEVTDEVLALAWQAHRRWYNAKAPVGTAQEQPVPLAKDEILAQVAAGKLDAAAASRLLEGKPAAKRTQVRGEIFGYSATSVIRAMGAMGMSFEDVGVVLAGYGLGGMSDTTIRIQIKAGKDGTRGPAAPLTDSQKRTLREKAK